MGGEGGDGVQPFTRPPQHKTENRRTQTHASSGTQTHNLCFRAAKTRIYRNNCSRGVILLKQYRILSSGTTDKFGFINLLDTFSRNSRLITTQNESLLDWTTSSAPQRPQRRDRNWSTEEEFGRRENWLPTNTKNCTNHRYDLNFT
jgi:hypothetical protein